MDDTAENDATCRLVVVDGQPVRVRGSGEWDDRDREAFTEVVRAATNLMTFHTHNEWTGLCGCGAGPFIKSEWAAHVNAQTAPILPVSTEENPDGN